MIAENSTTSAAPEGSLPRTVTASSYIQGESNGANPENIQKTTPHNTAAGVEKEVAQIKDPTLRSADEALASNDEGDQNQQQVKRTSTVSTGSEVTHDVNVSTPATSGPSISGDGEPAADNNITSVAGAEPNSFAATVEAANNDATNVHAANTQQELGRRGSEFLLIAAQAAEAAEFAEKAQSRADAVRQAAMQLTSASPHQGQQDQDQGHVMNQLYALGDGIQGQNNANVQSDLSSNIEIDEKLKAQVYSVAATMMHENENLSKFKQAPSLPQDGALHRPNPPKASDKPRPTPVKHVYHDYASAPTPNDMPRKKTGGVSQPFPDKLMSMLDRETANHPDVVTWCPHGRAFIVRKPKVFTAEVMINYFRQSKLTSFQRQLNLYGFRRITQGLDAGAYYHELFLRGRPDLTSNMVRQKVKGTGHKQPTDASTEPNFYAMPPVTPMTEAADTTLGSGQVYPHNAPMDFSSSKPPPMAVPDGTLYAASNKNAPLPSPSLQAVAMLRRLSNPALNVPTDFSLGAPAAQAQPSQQANNSNAIWSGQPDAYRYQFQSVDTSISPSKVHGFHPSSSLGTCPVASEAAVTMAQMFSAPSPAEGGENCNDSMGIQSYPV
mmetsp:Transcript_20417/g.33366  ORF Transcript_20417/g.33366 Transcript_20417/m.33366 type:complete len:610 (-) Transcript_20417:63-1892(-)